MYFKGILGAAVFFIGLLITIAGGGVEFTPIIIFGCIVMLLGVAIR